MNHDHAHCTKESCPKANECYRFQLYKEDIKLNSKYCYYIIENSIKEVPCDNFLAVDEFENVN